MTDKPSIIHCGGIVFITTPFPAGPVSELLPSWIEQSDIGVEVDLRATRDNTYFMVTINLNFAAGEPDPTPEEWNTMVHRVVEHVWNEMVDRGVINGTMPEIIKGNPLDMVPT